MFVVHKTAAPEDIDRIIAYCQSHTIKTGGLFEVYPGPGGQMQMVIVNTCPEGGPVDTLRPLGAFYCNYSSPGIIAIEEDPHHDGAKDRKRNINAVKQVIDILLAEGFPGAAIQFNDLPALRR